jgi:uncharacterized protein
MTAKRGSVPVLAGLIPIAAIAILQAAGWQQRPSPTAAKAPRPAHDYPVKPVPFTAVQVTDQFWAPRIEINRTVTIPFAFGKNEETGRVNNFVRAADVLKGHPPADRKPPGYPFDDTDIYKVLEGASYTLSVKPDPKLSSYLDGLIATIASAQEKDGYLYTTRTIDPQHPHPWAGTTRWSLETDLSHELYNLGHLYEAAVAHFQATGKRTLLEVALRTADLLTTTFGPHKASIWPGHQITEMGLAKLYRVTGDERYLALAKFMLDARGPDGKPASGRTYNQSQAPVVDQTEAVGHAVRATYMYSGMADVAALTGDQRYVHAIDRIWENTVGRKLYITGGIGSRSEGEAFGDDFELPNMSAYNETCAAVGNDYWNHRLFLLHGDGRYIDVLERTLYNGLLAGVSLDGKGFFYPNPLESNGQHERSPWFGVACCPGNITRFMPSLPGYIYAQRGDSLYVNLFIGSTADVAFESGRHVRIEQSTRYPWDGDVRLTLTPARAERLTLRIRIPGWARTEPVPSALYRFVDTVSEPVTLSVNGYAEPVVLEQGYAVISRRWNPGDAVVLHLPMPVRRVMAAADVAADRGRVAIQRGPIVYAAEWPDNPDGHVRNLRLPDDVTLTREFRPALLNGVEVITGQAVSYVVDAQGAVQSRRQPFTAIPYYAWANRGPGEMIVWIPREEAAVRPQPFPTVASSSKVTTSSGRGARAINDQAPVRSSNDQSEGFFHFWPNKGTSEWVEYAFPHEATVAEAAIYWYDDTGHGQSRVPASWRLLYKTASGWAPVDAHSEYGVGKDTLNRVTFTPVRTSALRLEVTLQPEFSAGILEWAVDASR